MTVTPIDPATETAEAIATVLEGRIVVRVNRAALVALIVKELRDGGWVKAPLLKPGMPLPEPEPN